jgi:Protein of unknown function (DUF2924)
MAILARRRPVGRGFSTAVPSHERGASIDAETAALRDLTLEYLRRRWRAATGQAAPARLPRFLLLRMLAYRLQAQTFGDLDKASVELLDRIGEAMTTAASQSNGVYKSRLARSPLIVPPVTPRAIKPGAMLVREWKGVLHRVMILDQGFAWNGATYASLSMIARAITGTEWNGPRFFGLRNSKTQKRLNGQEEPIADQRWSGAAPMTPVGFRRGRRKAAAIGDSGSIDRQRLLTGRPAENRVDPVDGGDGEVAS